METITVRRIKRVRGTVRVPGDKSISHRAIMLGSIATGRTMVKGFLPSEDCLNTLKAFRNMGVRITRVKSDEVHIEGKGLGGLRQPRSVIDCGNSGTTMRLISGILAGQAFASRLVGDRSLQRRPMDRIIVPLQKMGAKIRGRLDRFPPLAIQGQNLHAISYSSPIASAQVKSCLLFAGLYAQGRTSLQEPYKSRDHTERMLQYMGGRVSIRGNRVTLQGNRSLRGKIIRVPGDISSAAYIMALALLVNGSQVRIKDIGLNPTRCGILEVLKRMGAQITISRRSNKNNEPYGDMIIIGKPLTSTAISKEIIPRVIDEIPLVALLMTQATGVSTIRGAQELRFKESDRISMVVSELSKMRAHISERKNGMIIRGPHQLKGAHVRSYGDHRLAMTLVIAGMIAEGKTIVHDTGCIKTSCPGFESIMRRITAL